MARALTLVAATVAATLCGLASLNAQDEQRNRDPQRGAQNADAPGQQDQQAGQQQPGQQPAAQPGRQRRPGAGQNQPGQIPGQAQPGQIPGQPIQPGQQGGQFSVQQVEQDLAACIALANYSEITLSQLASEKAQNAEVKKFATQMVQDHTQALNRLKQIMPHVQQFQEISQISQSQTGQGGQRRPGQASRATSAQGEEQPGAQPATAQNRRTQDTDDTRSDLQPDTQRGTPGQRQGAGGQFAAQAGGQQHSLTTEIARQACKTKLEMTREMLSQKQGAEFDKCYMGIAVMHHVGMVAELQAIEGKNLPQLQGFVKQALPKTQEHLQMAKQIARKLEGEQGDQQFEGRQQRRPGTQGATEGRSTEGRSGERRSSESGASDDANQGRRGNQNRNSGQEGATPESNP